MSNNDFISGHGQKLKWLEHVHEFKRGCIWKRHRLFVLFITEISRGKSMPTQDTFRLSSGRCTIIFVLSSNFFVGISRQLAWKVSATHYSSCTVVGKYCCMRYFNS